jgi:hypothetical protein
MTKASRKTIVPAEPQGPASRPAPQGASGRGRRVGSTSAELLLEDQGLQLREKGISGTASLYITELNHSTENDGPLRRSFRPAKGTGGLERLQAVSDKVTKGPSKKRKGAPLNDIPASTIENPMAPQPKPKRRKKVGITQQMPLNYQTHFHLVKATVAEPVQHSTPVSIPVPTQQPVHIVPPGTEPVLQNSSFQFGFRAPSATSIAPIAAMTPISNVAAIPAPAIARAPTPAVAQAPAPAPNIDPRLMHTPGTSPPYIHVLRAYKTIPPARAQAPAPDKRRPIRQQVIDRNRMPVQQRSLAGTNEGRFDDEKSSSGDSHSENDTSSTESDTESSLQPAAANHVYNAYDQNNAHDQDHDLHDLHDLHDQNYDIHDQDYDIHNQDYDIHDQNDSIEDIYLDGQHHGGNADPLLGAAPS